MLLWKLFLIFMKIGFASFGGGYAVISMIHYEISQYGWITPERFQHIVALAGMSPGSIAVNAAMLIGLDTAGMPGAIAAIAGITLPSLIIIVLAARFFYKIHTKPWVQYSLYGLRPIIIGLIIYAAIHLGFPSLTSSLLNWATLATLLIGGAAFVSIVRYKVHPLMVIGLSACAGIVLF